MGVASNVGLGNANPTNVFLRSYKVYSPAFIGKPEVNRGNKSKYIGKKLIELSHYANFGSS